MVYYRLLSGAQSSVYDCILTTKYTGLSVCISGVACFLNTICRSYSETTLELRDKWCEAETNCLLLLSC